MSAPAVSEPSHVALNEVVRHYEGPPAIHALGPINLVIRRGEFFSIVGPSGCGKSTLLDVLCGLVRPTGLAVGPDRHVYVSDRGNKRIQVFDENGKFLDQWPLDRYSSVNFLYISADRHLWAADDRDSRIVEYDLDGPLLYAWGTLSDNPGGLFNIHGMTVDQEGNVYVAEVGNGRAQKFSQRAGADPSKLVGKPVYAAWK